MRLAPWLARPALARPALARPALARRCLATRRAKAAAREITVPKLCSAQRLAKALKLPLPTLLERAAAIGEPLEANAPLAPEQMELVGMECGVTLSFRDVDARRRPPLDDAARASQPLRPPVVTLMGHVDHGKTSLLDAFRGSSVAAGEAGGITQGVSAFVVDAGTPRAATFIDTPGHELFTSMREVGARATDVVVLVVAVDAGVQATTIEAIQYARDIGTPLVVAANKIDTADGQRGLEKLTQQLTRHEVLAEDLGGDVPVIGVSATRRTNLDALHEAILLQAEILELHAEPDGPVEGLVLESTVHRAMGNVATVLVQRGRHPA